MTTPMKLDTPLSAITRLTEAHEKALRRLGLETAEDLLYYFPRAYGDTAEVVSIASLQKGQTAAIFGTLSGLKTKKGFRSRISMAEAIVQDESGTIKIIWFHQAYLAKMLTDGARVRVEGKVSQRKTGELYFSNPKIEPAPTLFESGKNLILYPVYPETRGVTSNWIYHALQRVLASKLLETVEDPIPEEILKKYSLPTLKTAFHWLHTPQKKEHAEAARKRFAFEEIFFIQLEKERSRHEAREKAAYVIDKEFKDVEKFVARFPFTATTAQKRAIEAALADFRRGFPMSRLLEGDVGSGKTAVAATLAYAVSTSKPKSQNFGTLQVAYMAPTEILAQQHFESFIKYFSHLPINMALITGSGCRKFPSKINPGGWTDISRSQLLKWVASGEITVLVGTHALIQKRVRFKHLALAVVDEQHRFGINQRAALVRKNNAEETQIHAENKPSEDFLYKDLSYTVRGILFDIKKNLGLGHKEQIYQRAFESELEKRKINFSKEKQIPIIYNKKKIGVYQPDFVVDEKIIVEFKALPFIGTRETKQLWTYLKGSDYKLALLVNFGNDLEIKRVIYDTARASASSSRQSASIPHLLSMTATPIPRTLALTLYGDLDLTLLDEMPAGRKPIKTAIVSPAERQAAYEKIREELKAGRQLYVICPRIDEADPTKEFAILAKSVKAEAKRLKEKVFPEFRIEILHSKMKAAEKDAVMRRFKKHETDILVSTSVVEVGVNVENASLIIIEGAERFGLSQLHQLRGRVLRGTHQPYCFVFADSKGDKTLDRLKALTTAKNGFELAEFDLESRGAGALAGTKQWGLSDLAMEAIRNLKMVEAARTEARKLVEEDPAFKKHPQIAARLLDGEKKIHFE